MMHFSTEIILEWLAQFFWPLTRISSMMMTVTLFGARFVPTKIRLYLSIAITFAVMPMLPKMPTDIALFSFAAVILLIQQIIIGVSIGLVTQFVAQTFVLLGQIIGMQSSLGFASMVDPANGQNTPLLGQLYSFITTLIFLATDAHLQILHLILLSFNSLPVGEGFSVAKYHHLVTWFGIIFQVAMSMALATIISLLTVNISFGVMTRAAPQLNIFSLGFSLTLVMGLFLTLYLLTGITVHYDEHWQRGVESICYLINLNCAKEF